MFLHFTCQMKNQCVQERKFVFLLDKVHEVRCYVYNKNFFRDSLVLSVTLISLQIASCFWFLIFSCSQFILFIYVTELFCYLKVTFFFIHVIFVVSHLFSCIYQFRLCCTCACVEGVGIFDRTCVHGEGLLSGKILVVLHLTCIHGGIVIDIENWS